MSFSSCQKRCFEGNPFKVTVAATHPLYYTNLIIVGLPLTTPGHFAMLGTFPYAESVFLVVLLPLALLGVSFTSPSLPPKLLKCYFQWVYVCILISNGKRY